MSRTASAARLVSLAAARERVGAWRAAGERVVLANGVFDLLHVGHARYLAGARALGRRLVVAVNDDPSARALKGGGHPLVPARDRARLVAALRGVDLVVVFAEATADQVLEALRPDVHAKGTDYQIGTVPERHTMARLGGATAIAGDPKAHATRDLLARIRRGRPTAP
jgi:rfaE bifunctional protein nucleotidyltransferase chain/domain